MLNDPLVLRSGVRLRNRIAKAATEEQLAGDGQLPDERIWRLYERWASGGAGLVLTGHVMVDRQSVAQPGDIILDAESDLTPFKRWADAAGQTSLWMQINHPGRVVQRDTGARAFAPSAIPVSAGAFSSMFPPPTPMSIDDIVDVVDRFATTARRAADAGFKGVEIHAAHGYLISQFLSPLVNQREDEWGGSLENRARLLLRIVDAVQEATPPGFGVAVKLNSADFQRGGFDVDDAGEVLRWLDRRVDFVELSGGSIESNATSGRVPAADGRTLAREAYFLDLVERLVDSAPMPLMLTGGVRRGEVAEEVLRRGFALVGVATALVQRPEAPLAWLAGHDAPVAPVTSRINSKLIRAAAIQASLTGRMHAIGCEKDRGPQPPILALMIDRHRRRRQLRRFKVSAAVRDTGPTYRTGG